MSISLLSYNDRLLADDELRSVLNQSESGETVDSTLNSPLDCLPVKYLGCVRCSSKSKVLKKGIQSVQSEILYLYSTAQRKSLAGSYLRPLTLPTDPYQVIDICNYGIVIGERDPTAHTTLDINGSLNTQSSKVVVTKVITPLSNIVLWASIKFTHSIIKVKGHRVLAGAFIPISCSNAVFTRNTFIRLNNRQKFLVGLPHPPLFLCILRKVSSPRVLECHLFSCFTDQDAIAISSKLSDFQNGISKIGKLSIPLASEIASHSFTSHGESAESRTSSNRPITARSVLSNGHFSELNGIRRVRHDGQFRRHHCDEVSSLPQTRFSASPTVDRYPFSAVDTDFIRYARSELSSHEPFFGAQINGMTNRKATRSNGTKIKTTNGRVSSCDLVSCRSAAFSKPSILSTRSNHQNRLCCVDEMKSDRAISNRIRSQESALSSGHLSSKSASRISGHHKEGYAVFPEHQVRKHRSESKARHRSRKRSSDFGVARIVDTSTCPTCESCPECRLSYVRSVEKRQANSNDSGYPSKSGSIVHANERGYDTVDHITKIKVKDRVKAMENGNFQVNNYNGYIVKVDYDQSPDVNNNRSYVPKIAKLKSTRKNYPKGEITRGEQRVIPTEIFSGRKTFNPLTNGTSIKLPLDCFEEEDESTVEIVPSERIECEILEKVIKNAVNDGPNHNGSNKPYECQQCEAIIRDSPELSCEHSELFGEPSDLVQSDCPPLRPVEASNLTRWRSIENLRFKPTKNKSLVRRLGQFRFRSWVRKNLNLRRKKKRPDLSFDKELRYLSLAEPLDYLGGARLSYPVGSPPNRLSTNGSDKQQPSSQFLGVDMNDDKFSQLSVEKTKEIPEMKSELSWTNSGQRVSSDAESSRQSQTTSKRERSRELQISRTQGIDNLRPKNLSQVNLLQELGYLP